MPKPIPPEEWPARIEPDGDRAIHKFPPRPDDVQVREAERDEGTRGSAGHAGAVRADAPRTKTPQAPNLLRPEATRPPRWRRPPGQKDDLGEPTGP
jgi:hypothetical protein